MQNESYFEKVIEKYSDMVYRIALLRCGTVENAEDIFQDVFVKFSEKAPKFENEEHEKAWFIRVTINLSKNLHKSAWVSKVVALEENNYFETEEEKEIFKIVGELPENYKNVVYLHYYEGYKVNEIANILKTKEGTVKTWLSRAREMLKKEIEGGFGDE